MLVWPEPRSWLVLAVWVRPEQVELNPEKTPKNERGFFSTFQPTKMVGDDNKDVESRQVLLPTVQERLIDYILSWLLIMYGENFGYK